MSSWYQFIAHSTENTMKFESNQYLIWFQRYSQLKLQLLIYISYVTCNLYRLITAFNILREIAPFLIIILSQIM
jgi:hypothetical protein